MATTYKRRVSFNSLTPNLPAHIIEDEDLSPLYIPQQYLKKNNFLSNRDLNYGYDLTIPSKDVNKIFESFNNLSNHASGTPQYNLRKAPKLPPAPSKSILKNWENTESAMPRSLKKTSLVGLTDEQLLQMDKQYSNSGNVDLGKLKFDGDGYLPFSGFAGVDNGRRGSSCTPSSVANPLNLANLKGDIDRGLKEHSAFNSFSINFKTPFFQESESKRTVAVYINNHHQFESLIWALKEFAQEYDHLIIIYEINEDFNPFTNSKYVDTITDSETEINNKINRIINYYFRLIDVMKITLNLSVTFEIIENFKIWKILLKLQDLYANLSHLLIPSLTLDTYYLTNQTLRETLARNDVDVKMVKIPPLTTDSPPSSDNSESPDPTISSDDPLFNPQELSLSEIARCISSTQADLDTPYTNYLTPQSKQKEPQLPKITFQDTLHPGRKGRDSSSGNNISRDGSVNSRANSTGSNEFRKVKSLLDEDDTGVSDFTGARTSVKFSTSTIRKSYSNTERIPLKKQISAGSSLSVDRGLKKKKQTEDQTNANAEKKEKKGLFGFFKKKS